MLSLVLHCQSYRDSHSPFGAGLAQVAETQYVEPGLATATGGVEGEDEDAGDQDADEAEQHRLPYVAQEQIAIQAVCPQNSFVTAPTSPSADYHTPKDDRGIYGSFQILFIQPNGVENPESPSMVSTMPYLVLSHTFNLRQGSIVAT